MLILYLLFFFFLRINDYLNLTIEPEYKKIAL